MMIPFSKRTNGCPCNGCVDRGTGHNAGCHGRCDKYKTWREKLDAQREQEFEEQKSRDTMSEDAKRKLWRKQRYPYNSKHYRERDDR